MNKQIILKELKSDDYDNSGLLVILSNKYKHAILCYTINYVKEILTNINIKNEFKQYGANPYILNNATKKDVETIENDLFCNGYLICNINSCVEAFDESYGKEIDE